MLISHKLKFVIIDIPKTATASYNSTLNSLGIVDIEGSQKSNSDYYQHVTAGELKQKFFKNLWNWNDYYKYVTIRNPWSRFGSYLQWAKNFHKNFPNIKNYKIKNTFKNSYLYYDQIFKKYNFNDQKVLRYIIEFNYCQKFFFVDSKDKIIVDHVAKFENINKEFENLCGIIGVESIKLRHDNSGGKYNYKDFYNKNLIDLVASKENFIIEKYGYQY